MVRRQISIAKDDTSPTMFRGIFADMVELVDTLDLGSSSVSCRSSSLLIRTTGLGPVILIGVDYEPLRR